VHQKNRGKLMKRLVRVGEKNTQADGDKSNARVNRKPSAKREKYMLRGGKLWDGKGP